MNSLIKVTNLSTGQSAILRVTDPGHSFTIGYSIFPWHRRKRSASGGPVLPGYG